MSLLQKPFLLCTVGEGLSRTAAAVCRKISILLAT